MSAALSIRPLQPSDAQAYRDLRLEALRTSPEAFGSSYEEEAPLSLGTIAARIPTSGPNAIFGAFAKVAPERANGSPFATINALSLAGWREQRRRWIMFCFFGGGLGGNPDGDGLNHSNNPISTATIPPVEILESLYPVMFTQWALRPDSAGPGKHRGGLGAIYEIEALADYIKLLPAN